MNIKAQDVAYHFLATANECGSFISNLKLQKLLYYAQAWHLAIFDAKLFSEKFEAWVHGPVIPAIYHRYKEYGTKPILEENAEKLSLDTERESFFEELIQEYFGLDAYTLELLTHREDPWLNARKGIPPFQPSKKKISELDMKQYYGNRLKD